MKKWFNRVSAVLYLGAILMFLMLFCNPYINVILLLSALVIFLVGGAYVTEELNHTEGEKMFLKKFDKLFG